MKKSLASVLLIISFFIISCSKNDPYLNLVNSNLTGESLLVQLNLFEKEHTEDFRSKIDLANYFILIGDYNSCYEYLIRAESVIKNCPKGKEGKKYKTLLYGMRAQIELYSGNYEQAHFYVDRTIREDKKNNEKYNYLKAQIYIAQNDNEKALQLFDLTYEKFPEDLTKEDKQVYMYLLADIKRFDDCKKILDNYLDDGNYFYGLGSFASGIYESVGELDKAVLLAYLDYEYFSCYNGMNKEKFLNNLDTIIMSQDSAEKMFKIQDVINFVKSRVDETVKTTFFSDYYPAEYITFINKIKRGTFNEQDVQSFLNLEKYFSVYPSYYWNAWKAFSQIYPEDKETYLPLLDRVILLGNNIYDYDARKELGLAAGLNEEDAGKILLPTEVEALLIEFGKTSDVSFLDPLYDVLSLPENIYELNALVVLTNYKNNVAFIKELENKLNSSNGRLQERLQYILHY